MKPPSEGFMELINSLIMLGCKISLYCCDVTDRIAIKYREYGKDYILEDKFYSEGTEEYSVEIWNNIDSRDIIETKKMNKYDIARAFGIVIIEVESEDVSLMGEDGFEVVDIDEKDISKFKDVDFDFEL